MAAAVLRRKDHTEIASIYASQQQEHLENRVGNKLPKSPTTGTFLVFK
jgi:hypothetical protein